MAPGLGRQLVSPGPATRDGVVLEAADPAEAARTLRLTEEMIASLLAYDRQDFESMKMLEHWAPHMAWYGPAGIGTMRGYEDYRRGHGRPFVETFRTGAAHSTNAGSPSANIAPRPAGRASRRRIAAGCSWACRPPAGESACG
jgi:hypothetical protein